MSNNTETPTPRVDWIDKHMRFGRFLNFNPVRIICQNLTEWRFRSYWERTQGGNQYQRFTQVSRLMDEEEIR